METEVAWQLHRPSVYRYLRRRLRQRELAEDLTQEVFLRLLGAPPRVSEGMPLRAWLFRVAHHLVADYYRTRREELPLEEANPEPENETATLLRELEPCILRLSARLPDAYRAALLWDLEGMPQHEIARRQNLTLSGAKSRVQRARNLLQVEFERCCLYFFNPGGVLVAYTPRRASRG